MLSTALVAMSGCNMYSFIDEPKTDDQLLSAARACLDRGDVACAKTNYEKISGTSLEDVVASEYALTILEEHGLGMNVFLGILTDLKVDGSLLNKLVERIKEPSVEKRLVLQGALQKTKKIQNKELRGLIRILTSLAIASEILAEDAGSDGKLQASELVRNPTTCKAFDTSAVLTDTLELSGCGRPSGTKLGFGFIVDIEDGDISKPAHFGMIAGAIPQINIAIGELGVDGGLGDANTTAALAKLTPAGLQSYVDGLVAASIAAVPAAAYSAADARVRPAITAAAEGAADRALRQAMVKLGIGE